MSEGELDHWDLTTGEGSHQVPVPGAQNTRILICILLLFLPFCLPPNGNIFTDFCCKLSIVLH